MSDSEPSSSTQIKLFPGIKIALNMTMEQVVSYLKRCCIVDVLGNTIYPKLVGNDQTTYAIDFDCGWIGKIRKIKDKQGNNVDDETIFDDNDVDYDGNYDYDDL